MFSEMSVITIQVGQCGNQIAHKFWNLASLESNPSLFHTMEDTSHRARSVLIDMEPGVLNAIAKSGIGKYFDSDSFVVDSSGSGNNWATGHYVFGPKHALWIEEVIRQQIELSDTLGSFSMIHSLGGGTGSGLGSFVLEMLAEIEPKIPRMSTVVFPSDVITAPYNAVLALSVLSQHSTSVVCVDNESLGKVDSCWNAPIAKVLIDCFSTLNDFNVLKAFPQYLVPAVAPIRATPLDIAKQARVFDSVFSEYNPLISQIGKRRVDERIFFIRSKYTMDDIDRNIKRNYRAETQRYCSRKIPSWSPFSVSSLICSKDVFKSISKLIFEFDRLYKRKSYLHHYLDKIGIDELNERRGVVQSLEFR